MNANKRNEITEYDNKKINETKSGTLAYIGKKVRNYSNYKKNELKVFPRLLELKKKQIPLNDSNDNSENEEANNIKFINVKYFTNNPNNKNGNKKESKNTIINGTNTNNNENITNIKVINTKKTIIKDNSSTASSSNENKKYSLTKLDLIKKGLGLEPKKSQMVKAEEDIEKIEEENKDDGCVIL